MPVTVKDVCKAMDSWAPPSLAYDWDKVGLQIGEPAAKVSKILTCLTVTQEVVAKAETWGADMIVAHHPILFSALKTIRTDDPHTQLCLRLVKQKTACFAAHTNLDVVPGGVNSLLADTLGLQEVSPLVPTPQARLVKLIVFVPESHHVAVREAMAAAGAGCIGDYDECSFSTPGHGTFRPGDTTNPFSGKKGVLNLEPENRLEMILPKAVLGDVLTAMGASHPYEEPAYDIVPLENNDPRFGLGARGVLDKAILLDAFARHVRSALKLKHVRVVGKSGAKVKRIAVCGGAGGGEISRMPADIDVYVTGDLKYHEADGARERGLALIDAGHVGTERGIATHMARYLRKALSGVTVKPVVEGEIFRAIVG